MTFIAWLIDFALHLDVHLKVMAADYGAWVYLVIFLVVFLETGLVVTPFLPGDSLLFMVGTLSAAGVFGVWPSAFLLFAAAVLGDTANYHIGKFVGPRIFSRNTGRLLNKKHLEEAAAFYEKWGALSIMLGRFMPIIRTFVPFAAGIGRMGYRRFLAVNALGGALWVGLVVAAGYFFGNIPFVQKNMTPIIYAIVVVSVMPAVFGFVSSRLKAKKEGPK